MSGCQRDPLPDRTIIDQSGTIAGGASVRQSIQLQAGERLHVVLAQSGIDVHLTIEDSAAHVIGRFDSQTGKHGEERAVLSIARSGEYSLIVSAARAARVPGSYRLTAGSRSVMDDAEESYSRASDLTVSIDYRERIRLFEAGARAFEMRGHVRESGLALLAATNISVNRLSDAARSETLGKQAVRAFRDSGQSALLADALTQAAAMVAERNLTQEVPGAASRAEFEPMMLEARGIHEANGFSAGVAETNLYLGVALGAAGFGSEAIALWESSRSACHELGDVVCEAQALGSLGAYAGDVPDYSRSFESLYRAAALLDESVDPATLAEINVNLAFVLGKANHHDEAIERHRMALRDFEAAGECVGVSRAYYGIGYSLLGVGDYDQAVRYFGRALDRDCRSRNRGAIADAAQLEQRRPFADLCAAIVADENQDFEVRKVAMWSAWDLGNLARSRGDLEGAAACHRLAARVAPTANTRLGTNLERIEDLLLRGDADTAQREFELLGIDFSRAVEFRDSGHAWYLAHARELWARLLLARGETEAAFTELNVAAATYEARGNQEGRFDALRALGQLAYESGRPQQSAGYFSQADGVLESFRIATLNPSHRAMLLEARRGLYRDWISAARAAPDEELLDLLISERSRSRILTELAGSYVVDAQERAARMRFDRPTRAVATEDVSSTTVRPRFWELTSQSQSFDVAARRQSRNDLRTYQRSLKDSTTVVEFLLGEQDSDAWVMRRDSLHRVKLAGVAAIDEAVRDVRAALSGNADLAANRRALGELYHLVVAPLMPYVAGDALVIAADGVLHAVPFAALWDDASGQYLIQKMSVAMIPSLQFSIARRKEQRPRADSAALLVGDPVYEWRDAQRRCVIDPSVALEQSTTRSPLRRIPASAKEVGQIGALLASRDIEPNVLVGCAATRDEIIARLQRRYRILHFATHATADTEVPERSAIHLSAFDSKGAVPESSLSAADLFERHIDADLVVLSGCSSADGRRFAGDGTLGLTFAVLAAGGRNVVSSLWPIADEASVLVMQTFYAALLRENLTPNEALRRAQLALLEDQAWREPRYWGGYVLTGE